MRQVIGRGRRRPKRLRVERHRPTVISEYIAAAVKILIQAEGIRQHGCIVGTRVARGMIDDILNRPRPQRGIADRAPVIQQPIPERIDPIGIGIERVFGAHAHALLHDPDGGLLIIDEGVTQICLRRILRIDVIGVGVDDGRAAVERHDGHPIAADEVKTAHEVDAGIARAAERLADQVAHIPVGIGIVAAGVIVVLRDETAPFHFICARANLGLSHGSR